MDDDKNVLGGFTSIIDGLIPNPNPSSKITAVEDNEPLTEDELDDIKNKNKSKDKQLEPVEDDDDQQEKDDDEEDDDNDEPVLEIKKKRQKKQKAVEETVDPPTKDDSNDDDNTNDVNNLVSGFFDALAERLGWDFNEDDEDAKPKDVDLLIDYFQAIIEENSKPAYASDEIEALDEFVKLGGNIRKYLSIDAELDLEDIDMENEVNQRMVVKELLKAKGFSANKISKTLTRYEEAGILEDEANDAIEDLKELKEQRKELLLKELKMFYDEQVRQQQEFYNSVVAEIKGLKSIRGITVPEKDKRILMDYILKPDTDGKTKYQKDYAKGGVKNLIESAYFTMNADKFVEAAKREGNNSAIEKFKQSLKNTSVSAKSKQTRSGRDTDDDTTIWSSFTRQLRI